MSINGQHGVQVCQHKSFLFCSVLYVTTVCVVSCVEDFHLIFMKIFRYTIYHIVYDNYISYLNIIHYY